MKLCERITEKCNVIGDEVYHRPGLLKNEEQTTDFRTSSVVFKLENMNTVTDIIQAAKKMEGTILYTNITFALSIPIEVCSAK